MSSLDRPSDSLPDTAPADPALPASASADLDLLAASLRSDAADLDAFVEGLAVKLEEAVPGLVQVERVRRGLRGGKRVRRISLSAGGERLEVVYDGGGHVETRRAHTSGGIVLKTEPLDIDAWLQALSAALVVEAGRNERTRRALEQLLLG